MSKSLELSLRAVILGILGYLVFECCSAHELAANHSTSSTKATARQHSATVPGTNHGHVPTEDTVFLEPKEEFKLGVSTPIERKDDADLLITYTTVSRSDAGVTHCSCSPCQEDLSKISTSEQSSAMNIGTAHSSDPEIGLEVLNVGQKACTTELGACADDAGSSLRMLKRPSSLSLSAYLGMFKDSEQPAAWVAVYELLTSVTNPLTSQRGQPLVLSVQAIVAWYVTTLWSLCCMGGAIMFWVPLVVIPITCICSPPVHDTTSPVHEVWERILTCLLVSVSIVGVGYSSYLLNQGPVWLVLVMLCSIGCVQFLSLQAPGPSFLEFVSVVVLAPFRRNLHSLTSDATRI